MTTPRGHYENGRYIPEPSVLSFEDFLSRWIAAKPCAGCGLPLKEGPVRASKHRFYHPGCAPTARSVA